MKNIKLIIMSLLVAGIAFADTSEAEFTAKESAEYAVKVAEASNSGNITAGLAGIGAGLVVLGAGFGIGRIFGSAAEATARQPEAANEIRSTVNLPLFLLEGVGIIGLVVCILAVVL